MSGAIPLLHLYMVSQRGQGNLTFTFTCLLYVQPYGANIPVYICPSAYIFWINWKISWYFAQTLSHTLICISKVFITKNHLSGHANSCSGSDTRCTYRHAIKFCLVFELYLKIPIFFLSRKFSVQRTKATRCRKNYNVRSPFGGAQEWIFGDRNVKSEAANRTQTLPKLGRNVAFVSIVTPVIMPKMRNFKGTPDNSNVIGIYIASQFWQKKFAYCTLIILPSFTRDIEKFEGYYFQWRTEVAGLGVQPAPTPKFRRPSKIVPDSTRL